MIGRYKLKKIVPLNIKKNNPRNSAECYDQFPEHVRQLYRTNYGYFRVRVWLGLGLGIGLELGLR